MTALCTIPPARRPELVVGPPGADGQCVVKDPRTGRYFQLGKQEAFLLAQLDGERTAAAVRAAFEAGCGTVIVGIAAGRAQDLASNPGAALTSADNTATYDATAPTVVAPNITAGLTDTTGSVAIYTGASASDATSGLASPAFSPPPGSHFPVGATTVAYTATENAGNVRTGNFTVTVNLVGLIGSQIFLVGTSVAESFAIAATNAAAATIAINGVPVPSSPFNLTGKPLTIPGNDGDDTITPIGGGAASVEGGAVNNTFDVTGWTGAGSLAGGGSDAVAAVKNLHITLSNPSLAAGTMNVALAGIATANLAGGAAANIFTVAGWTGGGSLAGGGGADTVRVTKHVATTAMSDASPTNSDGMAPGLSAIGTATLTGGAAANAFDLTGWTGVDTSAGGLGADALSYQREATVALGNGSLAITPVDGVARIRTLANIEAAAGASNMTALCTIPPARRPELVVGPPGADGQCVVKDPRTGRYFQLGKQEAFLLAQLDGERTAAAVRAAFEAECGESLSEEDLGEFLEVAREGGLLQSAEGPGAAVAAAEFDDEDGPSSGGPSTADPVARPRRRQSLLYWRKGLFDPDRLLGWLEPKLGFVWTRPFLVISAGCILAAVALVWSDRRAIASHLPAALRWDLLALTWLTLLLATALHEFAHGLTCKHHGGEVHEIGFLLMYFMPCFYCNVSDAWLFPEKSKRLWVTLAGGYCDLVMWALATFAWRVTLPGSRPSHVACLVLSICGARVFFNFNPLLKLDGYYLVSDLLEVPNLRRRAWESVTGHLRWLLWGASRPASEPRGRLLLGFGVATWLYSLAFLCLMLAGFARFLDAQWGPVAIGFTLFMALVRARRRFRGILTGEVAKMIRKRRKRSALWAVGLIALTAALAVGQMEDWAGGPFQIRPATRVELRAPVAGFLRSVEFDEGDRVSAGRPVARLEVPDLDSRIERGRATRREARARLRLLEVGPRPEEAEEQRRRVERALAWRDLARRDLARLKEAFQAELERLKEQLAEARAEISRAEGVLARSKQLRGRKALSEEEYSEVEAKHRIALAREKQVEAQERARRAEGTLEAEAELARREKELAEARAALSLLEAGSRPEELDAARAHLARVDEEVSYLEGLRDKVLVISPVSGVVTTPRLRERAGLFLREGEPICELEALSVIEAEIALDEQDVARVRPGQPIRLKARALPFEIFRAWVDRIAPSAPRAQASHAFGASALEARGALSAEQWGTPGVIIVYCRPEGPLRELRSGMTGYARILCGRRPIGEILVDRVLRVLRTEFWW